MEVVFEKGLIQAKDLGCEHGEMERSIVVSLTLAAGMRTEGAAAMHSKVL